MASASQVLLYTLLAPLLPTEKLPIKDEDLLEELGLDPLDLALVAIRLEELEPDHGRFPLAALAHANSIGDLVEIVEIWTHADSCPSTGRSPS
jgi:hypothetical protein